MATKKRRGIRQHLASLPPFARRSFPIEMFQPSSGLMPDPADFSDPDDEPCEFGELPWHLRRAHHRPFVNDYWRRTVHTIETAVEICLGFDIWRVQVLSQVVYAFAPDGTVSVQAWGSPPHSGSSRVSVPPEHVTIDHPPFRDTWIAHFQEGFRFEIERRVAAQGRVLNEYTAWSFERLRRRIRHDCDVKTMRRMIRDGLAADPCVLSIAGQIWTRTGDRAATRVADYNNVVRRRAEYTVLDRRAPSLIPIFAVCADPLDVLPLRDPVARLRHWACAHGVAAQVLDQVRPADAEAFLSLLAAVTGPPSAAAIAFLRAPSIAAPVLGPEGEA
jgi:hypothetical protein